MLTYSMEGRNGLPMYDYLSRRIKEDIWAGKLRPGEKLPSKRALARNLEVSVVTVENAYAQLVAEGYLYTREKSGYFVSALDTGAKPTPAPTLPAMEEPEGKWLLDLHSGGSGTEGFPFAVWARLMRRVISDEGERLLKVSPHSGVPLRPRRSRWWWERAPSISITSSFSCWAGTRCLGWSDPATPKRGRCMPSTGRPASH